MAALTLGQMRERVRRVLRDKNGKFITDPMIDDWLNEAQLEIAVKTLCIQEEATGTTTTYQLAVPSNYLSVATMRLGSAVPYDTVEWVDNEVFNSWKDTAGTPDHTLGRIFENNFEFYPTPTSGTAYTLRYARVPTILDNDADAPEVMLSYQHNMVRYAQGQGKLMDGESGEAQAFDAMYREGLPEGKGPEQNYKPGPMTVRWEAGPFDTSDARHL